MALSGGLRYKPTTSRTFFDEKRIGRELEVLRTVRLQAEQVEVTLHARFGKADFVGHGAHTPMRRAVCRFGAQRPVDQVRHLLVADRSRFTRLELILQTTDTLLDEAPPPLAYGAFRHAQATRDRRIRFALCATQHDMRPVSHRRRHRAGPRQRLQLRALIVAQDQCGFGSSSSHWVSLRALRCPI
jgi:hypothetical protein